MTKVIGAVAAATGPLQVKPLKIVAGLEPENTNALLQGLAKAAAGGGAPAPEKKKPPAEAAPKKAPPPPEEAPKKERPKPAEAPSEDAPPAEAPVRRAKERAPPKEEEAAPPPRKEIGAAEPSAPVWYPSSVPVLAITCPLCWQLLVFVASSDIAFPPCQPPGLDDDAVGRRMERPRTALRGPPKVQTNTAVRDTRPTSKQDALRGAKVIGEGDDGSEDEDDAGGALGGGDIIHHGSRGERAELSAEGRGALVRNMMNAKADMDADAGGDGVPGASENIVDLNRNKDRQKTQEDMEKLRDAIQSLCQSSNPLARSMDYLQEDLDNMTKELDMWAKDKDVQTQLLDEEKRLSEVEMDKLMAQLQEVEDKIKEEELHIRDMKAQVAGWALKGLGAVCCVLPRMSL